MEQVEIDRDKLEQAWEDTQKRKIIVGKGWAHPPYFYKETQKWVVEYWEQDAFMNYPVCAVFDEQEQAQKYCKAIWDGDNKSLEASLCR